MKHKTVGRMEPVQPEKKSAAPSDYEIVLDVLTGNRQAYALLVRKYEVRMKTFCFFFFHGFEDAGGAARGIFADGFHRLEEFQGTGSFPVWLCRIAMNYWVKSFRKKRPAKSESWQSLARHDGARIEMLFRQPDIPVSEGREVLAKLVSSLPFKSRKILILREAAGLSYGELAEVLQCGPISVRERLIEARRQFESRLRPFTGPAAAVPRMPQEHMKLHARLFVSGDPEMKGENEDINAHLSSCGSCADTLHRWEKIRGAFSRTRAGESETFPSEVLDALNNRAKAGSPKKKPPRFLDWLLPALGYAFAVFLMIAAIARRELPTVNTEGLLLARMPSQTAQNLSTETPDAGQILGI